MGAGASSLTAAIDAFDYSTVDDPGFEPMRRLSHTEYDNTMRDLFAVDLNPTERFTEELSGASGFDNPANTLFLQAALMERYIVAAERVVDEALPTEPTTAAHHRTRDLVFVANPGGGTSDLDAATEIIERFLLRAYRRPPTEEELAGLLRDHIRTRILYREAVAMGLDQGDLVIERRLAQRLEMLAQGLITPEDPTEEELVEWYEANVEAFKTPDVYTLRHVFFDPDKRGTATLEDAEAVLANLQAMDEVPERFAAYGDRFMLQSYYPARSEVELRKLFGGGFVERIERIEEVDTLTGEILGQRPNASFFPSTHYMQSDEALARKPDAFVVSPGPCTPAEAGISVEVCRRSTRPLLGVCLGHQSLVVAYGGAVERAERVRHGKTSPIHHCASGVFYSLPDPFTATRYHSLVIEKDSLPDSLEITAWTDDGEIMGVRHKSLPVEGVQFHPESILSEHGHALLKNFLNEE